jgi:hypothetical protein
MFDSMRLIPTFVGWRNIIVVDKIIVPITEEHKVQYLYR